jgi:hypothetical protein
MVVGLLAIPPVMLVYQNFANKKRGWIIAAFLVLPLIYGMVYHHMFLNYLLKKGFGSDTVILGSPNIIVIHTLLMLLIVLLFWKTLVNALTSPISMFTGRAEGNRIKTIISS